MYMYMYIYRVCVYDILRLRQVVALLGRGRGEQLAASLPCYPATGVPRS